MHRTESHREYQLGDVVTWTSQSAGVTKVKTGPIVAIVPPRVTTDAALQAAGVRGHVGNPGSPRDHQSYVIRCEGRLYWPYVTKLQPASPAPAEALVEAETKPERRR